MELLQELFTGANIALLGGVLAAAMGGFGSARGVGHVGSVAAGILAEKPDLFGKLLILQALPGTQGIYGLLVWFFVMLQGGFLDGSSANITVTQGLMYFAACVPSMIVLYVSAIHQGKVAADGALMVAKKPEEQSKPLIMSAMVETYAILALLASVLSMLNVR